MNDVITASGAVHDGTVKSATAPLMDQPIAK